MTKEEYLKEAIPYKIWLERHKKYVTEALNEMREYFDYERFINDYKDKACREIIECILADSQMNNNYELGELEDNLARILCIPYEEIVEYRTEKFWEEIKDD